jgi:hypothetical protein
MQMAILTVGSRGDVQPYVARANAKSYKQPGPRRHPGPQAVSKGAHSIDFALALSLALDKGKLVKYNYRPTVGL